MKVILVSFADITWKNAFVRLKKQIEPFKSISNIEFFDEHRLKNETNFFINNPKLLELRPYGFGAWIWKTYIIEYAFLKYPDADFIVYTDSGNEFNFNERSNDRFLEYIKFADQHNVFAFMSQYDECQMTHCSLIDSIFSKSKNTKMINAGFLIFKNNKKSINVVSEWQKECEANDYYNVETNKPICCNRYMNNLSDQSVMSLVFKKNGLGGILDEADWIQCSDQPIAYNLKKYPVFNARNKTQNTIVDKCLKYFDSVKCIHDGNWQQCPNLLILR